MEDTKKTNETTKPEELVERVELTDEQLDQASGGVAQKKFFTGVSFLGEENSDEKLVVDPSVAARIVCDL